MSGGVINGIEITLEEVERQHQHGVNALLQAGIGMKHVRRMRLDDPTITWEERRQWIEVFRLRLRQTD